MKALVPFLLLFCGAFSSPSEAKLHLDAAGGFGVADQVWHAEFDDANGDSDLEFDAVSVWYGSISASTPISGRWIGGVELSWSQRGGSLSSGFVPAGQKTRTTEYRRDYLDLSTMVGYSTPVGHLALEPTVSFRASALLSESIKWAPEHLGAKDWVFGIDPGLRVSFRQGFLWTRYFWDVTAPYSISAGEMGSHSVGCGLGVRLR